MDIDLQSLEEKILGSILSEPRLFQLHEVSAAWFNDMRHQKIVYAMHKNPNFGDFAELVAIIKKVAPDMQINETELEVLSFDSSRTQDFEASLRVLKQNYYEQREHQAIVQYNQNPTKKNKLALYDRMRELEEAEQPDEDGKIDKSLEEIKWEFENDPKQGILTYPRLNTLLGNGISGGRLITIGARPGVGKTAFGVSLAIEGMKRTDLLDIDFFTFEMSQKDMLKRFASNMADINGLKLRLPKSKLTDEDKAQALRNLEYLLERDMRIYCKYSTISQVARQIRRRCYEANGDYIAFIDYLGLIKPTNTDQPRYMQIQEITRELKNLTLELDIPIVLFSQVNRKVDERADKIPNLSDLRESASIEQDSNVVGFLYEDPEDDSITKFGIAKNREGMVGDIEYRFIRSKMQFIEEQRT